MDEDAIEAMEADLMAFSTTVRKLESQLRIRARQNIDEQLLAA